MTVVRLGAWCDYVTEEEYRNEHHRRFRLLRRLRPIKSFRQGASFRVQEFADLDDGRRVTIEDGRGFSLGLREAGRPGFIDPWPRLTAASLEADVRTCVLPDDDDTDDEHPWAWLVERLAERGVTVSTDRLKTLRYDVELSPRLRARVNIPTES